ncbi:MAG: TM1802 family CRISPR-associated protein, partial [Nitrososphaerales archaeon]
MLVTIALESANGNMEYPGDIQPFVHIFTRAVSGNVPSGANFVCSVCNSPSAAEIHIPSPLEFLTQDQLIYIPSGDPRNKARAIALCQRCSDSLRAGQSFINSHLSFKIFRSRLFFWLVPILPDAVKSNYLNMLSGRDRPLYLSRLRDLCGSMEAAVEQSYGVQDVSDVDSWLIYLAIFCFKDTQGHTRVAGVAEGIYPSRLRKLAEASSIVQRRYPYFLCDPKIMFSFPLLTKFFEAERGESTIVNVMESLFTENIINPSYVISAIVEKVKSEGITRARKKGKVSMRINQKMEAFVNSTLQAMIIVEYLVEADVFRIGSTNEMPLTDNLLGDKYVDALRKYINSHRFVDQNNTVRSVFLVGVAVGILLEVQMKEFKSYPFWKHLNRLELDLIRIE